MTATESMRQQLKLNRKFSIIDTGGIDDVDAPLWSKSNTRLRSPWTKQMSSFCRIWQEGITDADEYVARMLYKTHKPIILAVNKVDNPEMRNEIFDFYVGLGRSIPSFFSPRDWYWRRS